MSKKLLYPPRPEQQRAATLAGQALRQKARMALVSPTGSGKSLIEAQLLLDGFVVTAPSMDICDGIARSLSLPTDGSEAKRRARYEAVGLWTYKRLHSHLAAGGAVPAGLVIDEGHHATMATLQEIIGMCPGVGVVLVTATLYRGTPQETADLLAMVNNAAVHVLTLWEAVTQGRIRLPDFDVWPLMDDELVTVANGEFNITKAGALATSVTDDLVARVRREFHDGRQWVLPGTLVLPSVAAVHEYQRAFGEQAVSVLGDTRDRATLFDAVLARDAILLQCQAVGEGTDLPLRFMVDASPTMSPTRWMQRVGRICRPADRTPRYITTCHNLLRHGYLFEGLIPRASFKAARTVWPADWRPSRRTVARAMGLTGFGRFEPTEVRLASGDTAFLYALSSKDGCTDLAALLIPAEPAPLYFKRTNRYTGEFESFSPRPDVTVTYEKKAYGNWARLDALPELADCSSFQPRPLTPRQADVWVKYASKVGLDASWQPDAKQLTALFLLLDTGMKL